MSSSDFLDLSPSVTGTTLLHKLDPLSKIIIMFCFSITNWIFPDPQMLLILMLVPLSLLIGSRVSMRKILTNLAPILLFMVAVFVSQLFYVFTEDPIIVFELGPLTVTQEGFRMGASQALRFGNLLFMGLAFIFITDPTMLSRRLNMLHVPMNISFMMIASLRILALANKMLSDILNSMITRGAIKKRGLIADIRSFRLVLLPLMVNVLRKSRQLGLSVSSKAYGSKKWNEFLNQPKLQKKDGVAIAVSILLLIFCLYLRFILGIGYVYIRF